MKIGKYPVKHRYRIACIVSDVFSVGLALMIFSVTYSFLDAYNGLLLTMGEENVQMIVDNVNSAFRWQHYLAWIFPALVLATFVVYIVLCCVSHPFRKYNVTKQTAQQCRDIYAFCASVCKIPALMGIFDAMYIFHQRMLGENESIFSIQIALDIILIAIIIRFGMHRVEVITAPHEEASETVEAQEASPKKVTIKPVKKEDEQ